MRRIGPCCCPLPSTGGSDAQLPVPRAVRGAFVPGRTRLLMLESPTNPRMQICDIAELSRLAHEARHANWKEDLL